MSHHDVHVLSSPSNSGPVVPGNSEAVDCRAGEEVDGTLVTLEGDEDGRHQADGHRHQHHRFRTQK